MKIRKKTATAPEENAELEKLQRRISSVENENAQMRALPTEVESKEDPSPCAESRRSANYTAYEKDVGGFIYH